MSAALPPLVSVSDSLVPRLPSPGQETNTPEIIHSVSKSTHHNMSGMETSGTSAVTRSWSHVDRVTLFATFAATSFCYALAAHPLFLAVARQQCCASRVSVWEVAREVRGRHGGRGLFRGAGAAVTGTVLSELLYYFVVEYGREHLPLGAVEQRCLAGGLAADLVSGPLYNPFAVVSQVQMIADSRYGEHYYKGALQTARTIAAEQGWRALFRGTLLTVIVSPLTGAWWLVYEVLKQKTYGMVSRNSSTFMSVLPTGMQQRLPLCCTSTTDNIIINCSVGAASSMAISILMNPLYVLRIRLQVSKNMGSTRFPAFLMMKNIFQQEGIQAFFKGIHTNLFLAAIGGCAFGMTYEGAKQFSDITGKN